MFRRSNSGRVTAHAKVIHLTYNALTGDWEAEKLAPNPRPGAQGAEGRAVFSPDWVIDRRGSGGTATINGVKSKVFQVDGVGMSHALDGHVYRNFHENKCYELSIRIATTNAGAYDPGTINEFSKEDWNEVYGRLKQALDSFKFLK